MMNERQILSIFLLILSLSLSAKSSTYVDKKGIVRWTDTEEELCIFGTNYSVPFSYWDQREAIGADQYKAIDEDVYHIARLGIDGYRIHVWDDYLSDTLGNLQENVHLELFDYLLLKLKERDIKIHLTAMTQFESSGYGFASKYGGRIGCFADTSSYAAQANYLKQFVNHINPHTGIAYKDDPDIIGFTILNEPLQWKAPQRITSYINQMYDAIRSTGCDKPIFYNMGTCSDFRDKVLASKADGITLQWYPSGLTSNHNQKGNMLPLVDEYRIPFADEKQMKNVPKFVYEFSPSDISASSHLYPAMARSFREAGFQFAAHFAYDPLHAAYCNIEYKTHYLNLAYTPKKSIGLMIASEAFHRLPLGKSNGRYPDNLSFDVFSVSYEQDLAQMLTDEVFLYSNNTTTLPPHPEKLKRIAGTGSSPIVNYSGTGAYFLDQLETGVWRLEVMPDALWVNDPFFVPSIEKEVAIVQWNLQKFTLSIPDLGAGFSLKGINENNNHLATAKGRTFTIEPGVYLLSQKEKRHQWKGDDKWRNITLNEFYAPEREWFKLHFIHKPATEISVRESYTISAQLAMKDEIEEVDLVIVREGGGDKVTMEKTGTFEYTAKVPEKYLSSAGVLEYYFSVKDKEGYIKYPSGERTKQHFLKSNRIYGNDVRIADEAPYTVRIVEKENPILLFDANQDARFLTKSLRRDKVLLKPSSTPGKLRMEIQATNMVKNKGNFSFRTYCADKMADRADDINNKSQLVLKANALNDKDCTVRISLILKDGTAYGKSIVLQLEIAEYKINLNELTSVKSALIPRPYPQFLPYWFEPTQKLDFDIKDVEGIQFSIGESLSDEELKEKQGVALEWIVLE